MPKKKHSIALIDMNVMQRIFADNDAAMIDYIKNFVEISAATLKKAEESIIEKNSQLTLDHFHQLKGPVGSIGFKKMYKLCEQIEENVMHSKWQAALEHCEEIEVLLKQLHKQIDKIEQS